MSAAAPSAHRQPPEPDSTRTRILRGESDLKPGDLSHHAMVTRLLRRRRNHQLPCEP